MKNNNTTKTDALSPSFELLISTVQELSLAKNLETIINLVRTRARQLSGADGASFVFRDNGMCYYVDEDAIAPLWKGKRFPMETCISGWAMLNKQSVAIEDIYKDERIPADAYRPTFVKSLLMVPIRTSSPIGAIGNYWASHHTPSATEIALLQALADSTSIAIQNVELYKNLETQLSEYKILSEKLSSSLEEKDVLLKEVYHRVKNNLQVTTSILNLHLNTIDDRYTKNQIIEITKRIRAMALVHEMLYQSENMSKINMAEYIANLLNYIIKVTDENISHISIKSEAEPIYLNMDTAIPCGLIINELVTNIIKHAFPDNHKGSALITMKQENGRAILTVKDDGRGTEPTQDKTAKKKLGLNLIENLAKQLNGKADIKRDNGTSITITFPL